ncbi:serine hydrolase [Pseudomonas sp. ITA]|uniref:serine hydrolase n=1 Tax=Pseudomonas sp. ITA TaxID=2825841 RepID=UPI002498DAC6|nr:serine hydrolase [Pseudomonas sp. ITA]MDI2145877.1 serine hydrolase [Pseudomonas sp. ITA]
MKLNGKNLMLSAIAVSLLSVGVVPLSQAERANRGNPELAYRSQSVDQMIADFMKEKNVSGITMAIVQAPYIPRVASYGKTDNTKELLASTGTLWNIGPITQGYTAVAVMQLVEANKMRLDAPIGSYVQNLPKDWAKLTVMQLMQHATGIADYREMPGFDASREYQPQQLINSVRDKPLSFKPGTQVAQSATNFLLLGLAIEKASGMSYHDMIWNGQIKPLGLTHTMFAEDFPTHTQQDPVEKNGNWHSRFTADRAYINPIEPATGYTLKDGKVASVPRNTSSSLFAFGSLWASAEDVSIWDIGLAGNLLIKEKSNRDMIYNPTKLDNGTVVPAMAGWQFTGHKGFMDIKGSVPGYSAYLSRFTDRDELVCVTLLANGENVDLTDLARRIAVAYDATLGSDVDPGQQKTYESSYSVEETTARLEKNIKAAGGKVFASLDQTANGKEVGMELRPTRLIVFGNAKAGTKLMQDNVSAAADLPLHISVWKDGKNQTWIGYGNLDELAKRTEVKDPGMIAQMKANIEEIVRKSASVY